MGNTKYLTPIRDLSKEPLERGEYLTGYHLVCDTNAAQGDGSVVYKCFVNGNIPSNVLNVAEPSSLRKLNSQKSENLRILLEDYIYLDPGEVFESEVPELLESINGHLDLSYYTVTDGYEEMFEFHKVGLEARNFKNCIFSHTQIGGGFNFRGCNFQGSTFKDVIIIETNYGDYLHFEKCDLRNVKFDESTIQNLVLEKCIIDSKRLYDNQVKEDYDNMLILESKAFNVLKEISNEHYDFSHIDFEGLSFKGFNRLNGVYKHCNFNHSNFRDINIIANINFSTCRNADFSKTLFSCEAKPFEYRSGSAFSEMPKIVGVDFTNANFEKAEISNCMFIDCNFEGVNFSGAVYSDDTLSRSNCIPKDAIDVMIHIDDAEDEDDFLNWFR